MKRHMSKTTIEKLAEFGQSAWLDNISRNMIETGKLKQMIGLGLRGMTSNPTIFDKSISLSNDYDERIKELHKIGKSVFEIYDELTIKDVGDATDIFKSVYDKSSGLDGYVSLEINPKLASKTKQTIEEGRRLFKKVNRPNIMFKVPSTDAGFEAIEELLAEGINVNVTLIFSVEQYIKTAEAYIKGMHRLSIKQEDLSRTSSVASVFVSRVDTVADKMLDEHLKNENNKTIKNKLQLLKGKAAVANSKLIYQKYLEIFSGEEFRQLKAKGANSQRVLWGSTSTKNPAYSDIKYVSELIGRNTVNTMPENTFQAFLDHGLVQEALTSDIEDAKAIIDRLKGFKIDINSICVQLLRDGVIAFEKSFESLLNSIKKKAEV